MYRPSHRPTLARALLDHSYLCSAWTPSLKRCPRTSTRQSYLLLQRCRHLRCLSHASQARFGEAYRTTTINSDSFGAIKQIRLVAIDWNEPNLYQLVSIARFLAQNALMTTYKTTLKTPIKPYSACSYLHPFKFFKRQKNKLRLSFLFFLISHFYFLLCFFSQYNRLIFNKSLGLRVSRGQLS